MNDSPRRAGLAAAALVCSLSGAAFVEAQDAAEARSEAFQAVEGAVTEDVPGGPLLVGAYALILAGLLAYVVHLVRLQAKMGRDVERLERALNQTGGDGEG